MKKRSWRERMSVIAKSEPYTDDFTNYKVPDSKGKLPNRAEFSGDKLPSTGDPAKKELTHWKDGNSLYEKDKKVEEKAKVPSPIIFEKNHREFMGNETSERKSGWRNTLLKFSDVDFTQSPDGEVAIKVKNESPAVVDTVVDNVLEEDRDEGTGTTTANKKNWREVLSGDADMDFSRKPDGTMTLKVKHLQEDENLETFPPSQSPQNPTLEPVMPSPVQEVYSNKFPELAPCNEHKGTKEYILRKDKNLWLIARECEEKIGIFIERRPKGTIASRVKGNIKVLAQEVHERNGKQWRELINSTVWETKYDEFLKKE